MYKILNYIRYIQRFASNSLTLINHNIKFVEKANAVLCSVSLNLILVINHFLKIRNKNTTSIYPITLKKCNLQQIEEDKRTK